MRNLQTRRGYKIIMERYSLDFNCTKLLLSNSRVSVNKEMRLDIGPQVSKQGGKEESEQVCQFSHEKLAKS